MYDRGLWQIDNQAWTSISNTCAFTGKCNADGAYAISQRGASFSSLGYLHQRCLHELPDRGPGGGPGARRRHGAQRRGRRLPVPARRTPRTPRRSPAPAAAARDGSSGASPATRSATATTASRSRRRPRRPRSGCGGATGAITSSGQPWATACCATPWAAGACVIRGARSPRAPRSMWARASRPRRASGGCHERPLGPGPCRIQGHGPALPVAPSRARLGSRDMGLLSEDDISTELAAGLGPGGRQHHV